MQQTNYKQARLLVFVKLKHPSKQHTKQPHNTFPTTPNMEKEANTNKPEERVNLHIPRPVILDGKYKAVMRIIDGGYTSDNLDILTHTLHALSHTHNIHTLTHPQHLHNLHLLQ